MKRKQTIVFKNSFLVITVFLFLLGGIGYKNLAGNTPKIIDDEYIYLDLALGNITLTNTSYTGFVYESGESTQKSGTIDRKVYIYQSNGDATIWENGIPKYDRVGAPDDSGKVSWREYITNNTDIDSIITNWDTEAASVNRTSTPYRVSITGTNDFDVTIDNLWSSYHEKSTSRTTGGLSFYPNASSTSKAIIRLKGDNRFGNIFYHSKSTDRQIIFEDFDDATVTLANLKVGASNNVNYWCSALGGNDGTTGDARGIVINGGTIFAGTTYQDNCTAIGAGGNDYGDITINGGTITAVASTTGTAIGGGIGYNSQGGNANVKITGGTVYAYNFGYEGVPAAAIGGGSSSKSNGNAATTITITGGNVYAESVGGTAIGGGSSKTQTGGPATINIGGDAIVTAKSVAGTYNGTTINAGAAIGGGTAGTTAGKNGGDATVNIYGNAKLYTGSIGGGKTNNSTGKIGNATIVIEDNPTIQGQFIMAAGAANPCSFEMSGGIIDNSNVARSFVFLQELGGAVYVENGDAELSGGKIINCSAENGGAVYVSGGNFIMTGGTISGNYASENGGAVYVSEGNFTMTSGTVSNNNADIDGGAICVDGGNIVIGLSTCLGNDSTHSHPVVSNNIAQSNGGAFMVSGGKITMYCGNLKNNEAKENQSSNNVKQEGGEFNIAGGELGLGVNVTGGEYNDTREGIYQIRYYTQYNDVSNSIIVTSTRDLILPNESYSEFDETFDRRDEGLWIVGWSTKANSTEGAIFVGDRIYVSESTELYAVYDDEEPIASFVVEIPTMVDINKNDEMSIITEMTNFTNIAELQIKITGKEKMTLDGYDDVEIGYDLVDLKTNDKIYNDDVIILKRDERKRIDMSTDIEQEDISYSGQYRDIITFEIAYETGI